MILQVTTHKGEHEAVLENEVAEMVFNKMTGRTIEPLKKEIVPDTWHELEQLFNAGKLSYMPVNKDLEVVSKFNPQEEKILFIAPHVGG